MTIMKKPMTAKWVFQQIFAAFLMILSGIIIGGATWAFIWWLPGITYRIDLIFKSTAGLTAIFIIGFIFIHVAMKLGKEGLFAKIKNPKLMRSIKIVLPLVIIILTASITLKHTFSWFWADDHINRGPYLSWVESPETTMTITIDPRMEKSNYVLHIGETRDTMKQYGQIPKKGLHYTITVRGLKPGTTYFYNIPGFYDTPTAFHTAPTGEIFSFVTYGDTRNLREPPEDRKHRDVVKSIMENAPESLFVVNLGDLPWSHSDMDSWDVHFETTQRLSASRPYLPIVGNHDGVYKTSNWAYPFFYFFELPEDPDQKDEAYEYSIGKAYFLFVHQNIIRDGCADWMEGKLKQAANSHQWVFVFFHHPPWSGWRSDLVVREFYSALFDQYRVTAVFSSHNHFYERVAVSRKNTINYIVTGGGGAPLYQPEQGNWGPEENNGFTAETKYMEKAYHFCKVQVSQESATLFTIDVNGKIIDTIQF